ncbi:MAG: response regulator transcription factor [Butyrivibrio sp.]|nr:response regulator transcription factor [Acetatifactor muris]MCM1560623.1 response regulator transcription factor [Butyrivibrio sp.]
MSKILIIEDNADINNLIGEALKKAGYEYIQAFSGTEGLLCASAEAFDLAVMDLMMPGMSGEELLPKLREKQNIPVIILSAKDGLDSKLSLFEAGAEDYMTKPFEVAELVARIGLRIKKTESGRDGLRQSECRQSGRCPNDGKKLVLKDLTLDREGFCGEIRGERIAFTRQEFKILELLLSNPQRVFSKQDIYTYAWEDYYVGEDKTVNMHISNIRKKLKAVSEEEYIETVWGIGFKAGS